MNVAIESVKRNINIIHLIVSMVIALSIALVTAIICFHMHIPIKNDFLLNSSIEQTITVFAICYLYYVYKQSKSIIYDKSKIVMYAIGGVIANALINYPYNIINHIHAKPGLLDELNG